MLRQIVLASFPAPGWKGEKAKGANAQTQVHGLTAIHPGSQVRLHQPVPQQSGHELRQKWNESLWIITATILFPKKGSI